LLDVLQGARNGYRDTILFNAAAALMVAGAVGDLREGVARAAQALDSGAALRVLETLRAASQEVSLA
jgi:anthranilate phosphoribosyltransferase